MPDLTTFYLATNLPAPESQRAQDSELAAASLEEVVRLYGLRMWVQQSYKHVKHALGWSQYQVRSDKAIRRYWQLVCCAFSFCWYHVNHPASRTTQAATERLSRKLSHIQAFPLHQQERGKKSAKEKEFDRRCPGRRTLVPPGSATALYEAIVKMLSLGTDRQQYGQEARIRVLTQFAPCTEIEAFMEVYWECF